MGVKAPENDYRRVPRSDPRIHVHMSVDRSFDAVIILLQLSVQNQQQNKNHAELSDVLTNLHDFSFYTIANGKGILTLFVCCIESAQRRSHHRNCAATFASPDLRSESCMFPWQIHAHPCEA